ncbi:hypothetical protein Tsubulata_015149 [Turnera subulata]|uniref:Exocyst subunit Exo70 family protein n=1 Tax=Turnera subulata TaxID=218843 RepID=A0A9Q0IYI7_9ROSI|nr:hypothetical protein Tsubulata_015149 [Turnera subulata]
MERLASEKHASEKLLPEESGSFKDPEADTKPETTTESPDHPGPQTGASSENPKPEEGSSSEKANEGEEEQTQQQQQQQEQEGTEDNKEQSSSEESPPEIEYTLEKVSPDIDHFLATFSVPKESKESKKETTAEEKKGDQEGEEEAKKDDEKDDKLKTQVEIPVFVGKFLDLVEEVVAKHDSNEWRGKWGVTPEDDASFLQLVSRISKLTTLLEPLRSDRSHGALINRVGCIQQRAMTYLEEEFRLLLEDAKGTEPGTPKNDAKGKQHDSSDRNATPESEVTPEVVEDYFLGYSDEAVANLNRIAKEMIEGGYEMECCQVYMMVRGQAFDMCFTKIGFEKISIDEVQRMPWESLEREIPLWIKTVKDCATIYFSKERKLAESVFSDFPSISASLFSNLTRGVVIQILNFAEGVAMTKFSAEKLFKFLDMYEALRDNLPAIGGLFSEEYENELKTETNAARCKIGETAICMFCDLENSIKSDTSKTPVPGGAVHPSTRYTMNYLTVCCEYKTTLEQVFKEHTKIERADSTSRPRFEGETTQSFNNKNDQENQSPFANQLNRIMDLLDSYLEFKSKLYRDVALSCIFMMNNGRYILQKIKRASEIHQAMGDTWFRKKSSDLRNYHKNYKVEAWSKLLACLSHEGLQSHGKVMKPVLKERFKNFNALFDDIHKTQSTWVVCDEQLQSELRVSISAVVIPAYRSFLGRFSQYFAPGRQYEKYIKFQPEDIETYIDELFDGNAKTMARKRQ